MKQFENLHKGEKCFIVGNGPSLAKTPLDRINGYTSFAMNRISLIYEKTSWRPDYFICTTNNIKRPKWRNDILSTFSLGIRSFVASQLKSYTGCLKNIEFVETKHGNKVSKNPPLEWWSFDPSENVCKFGTSMLVAFQIAFYMGFKEIYIVGADLGFEDDDESFLDCIRGNKSASKSNHFDDDYNTPGFSADILNKNMRGAHRLARAAARKKNVKIFNATLGGNLEIHPRKDIFVD